MRLQVRLRAEAEHDLHEAANWHEAQRDGLGCELLDEALLAFARISESPDLFPEVHRRARRALLDRFPFGAYFVIDGTDAIVIAIMHASRDPARTNALVEASPLHLPGSEHRRHHRPGFHGRRDDLGTTGRSSSRSGRSDVHSPAGQAAGVRSIH